ncbi:hypothetical protein C2G38_2218920 [Gigaspora rosea]|uniref:Uncharacterized protein n=1 Tax=Gigaspora rosea TaxID=44941 RepID=A0A397UF17_9GLOM|nr:hypothetical protein C2G38_2218920 [Gigaspora rosea]
METSGCTGCGGVKPVSEFVRPGVTGEIKQFLNLDNFDTIEPSDLCSHFVQILDNHSAQPEDPFQFQCDINISTFDKSPKEIAEELVELIEDVDEFA